MSESEGAKAPSAPRRIDVYGYTAHSDEQRLSHSEANKHLPKVRSFSRSGPLAVVGGGPLIADSLPWLRTWGGEIWGINNTARWLIDQGIDATLFTVDSEQIEGAVPKAIVASVCDPKLIASCGETEIVDLSDLMGTGMYVGSSSSAGCAAGLALVMGYSGVHWFGCEGSFSDTDHVDRNDAPKHMLIIEAGGVRYKTTLPFMTQCQELSLLIRTFPIFFHDRSGGLLSAMVEYPDTWEVVAVSAALRDANPDLREGFTKELT